MHLLNFQICSFLYGHGRQRVGTSKDLRSNIEIDSFFLITLKLSNFYHFPPHLTQIFTFSPTSCPWHMNQKASMKSSCRSVTYIACCTLKPGVHRKSFILGFKLIYLYAVYICVYKYNIYKDHMLCPYGYILASQNRVPGSLRIPWQANVNSYQPSLNLHRQRHPSE